MKKNKFTTYLLYAVGEIILVVIGILIAVNINNWNQGRKEQIQQANYYRTILIDLRKDSILFQNRIQHFEAKLKEYYRIYGSTLDASRNKDQLRYDLMIYNTEFAPVTQLNQQGIIERLKDEEIRNLLNDYFLTQNSTQTGVDEHNYVIKDISRPYLMDAANQSVIFQQDTLGFIPPDPVLITSKVEELLRAKEGKKVLNYLRITSGYSMAALRQLLATNNELINAFEEELTQ